MSVEVFTTHRPATRPGRPCPDWCGTDHLPPHCDDGVHCSEPLAVELATEQHDHAKYVGGGYTAVLVTVQHYPGEEPFLMLTHHDGMVASEDRLTVTEAEKLAWALEKNASIIRACGDHTCWCDGMHTPQDDCWGECEEIPLSLSALPYTPEVNVVIVRGRTAPATVVHLVSHNERDWDTLTPDEADRLAANLRHCAAILAVHQARIRLEGLGL